MSAVTGRSGLLAILAVAGSLAGCATPADPQRMTLAPGAGVAEGAKGYHALRVGPINGGGETNPLWLSDVSGDALRQALSSSLRNRGYLADDAAGAPYEVTADIVELDRPWGAKDPVIVVVPIDMSVSVRIRYVVAPAHGGPPVFDDVVGTTATATADDSMAPDARVRIAEETAVRDNIQTFLGRLQARW